MWTRPFGPSGHSLQERDLSRRRARSTALLEVASTITLRRGNQGSESLSWLSKASQPGKNGSHLISELAPSEPELPCLGGDDRCLPLGRGDNLGRAGLGPQSTEKAENCQVSRLGSRSSCQAPGDIRPEKNNSNARQRKLRAVVSKGIREVALKRLHFGAWMGARFCRRKSGEKPQAELTWNKQRLRRSRALPGNSPASSGGQWPGPGLWAEAQRKPGLRQEPGEAWGAGHREPTSCSRLCQAGEGTSQGGTSWEYLGTAAGR